MPARKGQTLRTRRFAAAVGKNRTKCVKMNEVRVNL